MFALIVKAFGWNFPLRFFAQSNEAQEIFKFKLKVTSKVQLRDLNLCNRTRHDDEIIWKLSIFFVAIIELNRRFIEEREKKKLDSNSRVDYATP
jgi:hypothetical protein